MNGKINGIYCHEPSGSCDFTSISLTFPNLKLLFKFNMELKWTLINSKLRITFCLFSCFKIVKKIYKLKIYNLSKFYSFITNK